MKKIFLIIITIHFAFFLKGQQLKVELEGNVNFDNSNFIIAEAGEDFPSGIESESSFFISVLYTDDFNKKKNPNTKWSIKVFKSDLTWHNNLMLECKRTGNGDKIKNSGNANIHDGENYQEISNTSTYFFRGKSEIAYIPIALIINGLSLVMGAETFETSVVFTVYDEW